MGHGGMANETAAAAPPRPTPVSDSAYLSESLQRQAGATTVAVIGAGFLGRCLALDLSLLGVRVLVCDTNPLAGAALASFTYELLNPMLHLGYVTKSMLTRASANIRVVRDLNECQGASLVLEAIPDKLEAKVELFRSLERLLPPTTILATSTIELTIDSIQEQLSRPERFLGVRFFHPCVLIPPVEITVGARTSDATVAAVVTLLRRLQKSPHRGPTHRVLSNREVGAFQFDTAVRGNFYHGLLEPKRLPVHEFISPADGPPLAGLTEDRELPASTRGHTTSL